MRVIVVRKHGCVEGVAVLPDARAEEIVRGLRGGGYVVHVHTTTDIKTLLRRLG